MEDSLHVVPVGVEHVRAVVAEVVPGAFARRAVVNAACRGARRMECGDLSRARNAEGEVHVAARRPGQEQQLPLDVISWSRSGSSRTRIPIAAAVGS